MLESLASCLKTGGRNLFRSSRKDQTRYAFWSHGACSIDLPAWWILFLQTPVAGQNVLSPKGTVSADDSLISRLQYIFLGFLYPVKTFALIRKIKHTTGAHQQAIQNIKLCSRGYTSLAHGVISKSQRVPLTMDLAGQATIAVDVSGKTKTIEAIRQRLEETLDAGDWWRWREDLWNVYQDLMERHAQPYPHQIIKILRRLSASDVQEDAERLLAVFQASEPASRRAIHYSYAISAALKLNDIDTALYTHRGATSEIQSAAGASGILRYAIGRENWDVAISVWQAFDSLRPSITMREDLWTHVKALPFTFMAKRASSAADFAIHEETLSSRASANAARDFAIRIMETCFQIRGTSINLSHWRNLLVKMISLKAPENLDSISDLAHLALEQALSLEREGRFRAALDAYQWIREELPGFALTKDIFRQLHEHCAISHDAESLESLVDHLRSAHGSLDIKEYDRILGRLAHAGEATAFRKVYELFRIDHSNAAHKGISLKLLQLYYRRADPNGAVQAFHLLEAVNGLKLDVDFYNAVISTFSRVGDVDGTQAWLCKLKEAGCKPNQFTYRALMLPLSKRGDRAAVLELYQQASLQSIEPHKAMIGMLVIASINDEKFDEAETLLEEAIENYPKGQLTHMWNIVLNAHAHRKDLTSLKRLHNRMHQLGVPSDESTYGALVTGLSAAKFPAIASTVVRNVMPRVGVKPTALHYSAIMGGYIQTKEYGALFNVYKYMLAQGLASNMSTNNILLRATARMDERNSSNNSEGTQYVLARNLFDEMVASLNPTELASLKPIGFVGVTRLDEAFVSNYFDQMIYLYGSSGAISHVSEVFDTYIKTARKISSRDIASSPPIRILSALLVYQRKAGNHEEVERCWYLALDKCEQLCRRASIPGVPESVKWVLPGRRFVINFPLQHYISHLGELARYDELVNVIKDLMDVGYDLNHRNWNVYIQYLCKSKQAQHQMLAFRLCEKNLMHAWDGWASMGTLHRIKEKFKRLGRPQSADRRAPTYLTFVWLARAYVDLGFGRMKGKKLDEVARLQESGKVSRTVEAVRDLPRIADDAQATILLRR